MPELSVVVDESGGENGTSKYLVVTLVFHDQSRDITPLIGKYEQVLLDKKLTNLPMHTSPLMYGKYQYERFDLKTRKQMLKAFFVFTKTLPISYVSFIYKRQELPTATTFKNRLSKDLKSLLETNLKFFQQYERVKVYYDNGQSTITNTLDEQFKKTLSKQALMRRIISPTDYRLAQVADFICTIELSALKYDAKEATNTDNKVFGDARTFRQNYLKQIRRLRMN